LSENVRITSFFTLALPAPPGEQRISPPLVLGVGAALPLALCFRILGELPLARRALLAGSSSAGTDNPAALARPIVGYK
jgi:hypothetical protein